jgi:hypothetical protein
VALAAGGGPGPAGPASAPDHSLIVAVAPFRILDTRNGTGTGGATNPVGPDQTITLKVAGVGPVPADATGAILNITATEGTAPSFITAWPTGLPRPTASVLNVNPGQNLPNMITVALGRDGQLDLYNLAGTVHLVADVAGYLVSGSAPQAHTLELSGLASLGGAPASDGCVDLPDVSALVDIPLPAGAVITQVRVRYVDTTGNRLLQFGLERVDMTASGFSHTIIGAGGVTAPAPPTGITTIHTDPGTVLAPVSDSTYYYLYANPVTTFQERRAYCGLAVDYTLPGDGARPRPVTEERATRPGQAGSRTRPERRRVGSACR